MWKAKYCNISNNIVKTIGKHINNALKEELLGDNSVVAKFATTASDGKTYKVEHYNLDVILSFGYIEGNIDERKVEYSECIEIIKMKKARCSQ